MGNEPYMHRAVIAMLAWFYEDGNGAKQFIKYFKSSLPDDPVRSKEPEIPASMLATAVTMVRSSSIILDSERLVN
jgi:hypothetical protein